MAGFRELVRIGATWRATILVGVVLLATIALTGAASAAYKRERVALGEQHFERAQQLAGSGDPSEAIEEYRKALLFLPDNTTYRLALATGLLKAGRLNEADSHLEQLSQEDPTNPLIYVGLARIAVRKHQVTKAIQEYQRAVYEYWPASQVPMRRQARWELVNLLASSGRRNETVGELIQLYASAPPDPTEREKIGFLLLQYGGTSEANRVFTDLARAYPHEAAAQRGLAQIAFSEGDYVSARHDFQRAVRLDPGDRESADGLKLTNTLIDLDPALRGISPDERRRRSENLLRRVIADVSPCVLEDPPDSAKGVKAAATTPLNPVEAARQVLNGKHAAGEDVPFTLQQVAGQLWGQRGTLCGGHPVSDSAVDLVMTQIGYE